MEEIRQEAVRIIRKQKEHEAMEEYRKRLLIEQHEKEEAAVGRTCYKHSIV